MIEITLTAEGDVHESAESLAERVEQALKLSGVSTDSVSIHTPLERDGWEKGDPCPDCGHESLVNLHASDDIYVSEGGHWEYTNPGSNEFHADISIVCPECHLVLREYSFAELLYNHD